MDQSFILVQRAKDRRRAEEASNGAAVIQAKCQDCFCDEHGGSHLTLAVTNHANITETEEVGRDSMWKVTLGRDGSARDTRLSFTRADAESLCNPIF